MKKVLAVMPLIMIMGVTGFAEKLRQPIDAEPATVFQTTDISRKIPNTILGFGQEYICRINCPGAAKEIKNPAFLQAMREMNIQSLRGPGGTPGNFYLWRTGFLYSSDEHDDAGLLHYPNDVNAKTKVVNKGMGPSSKTPEPIMLKDIYAYAAELDIPYTYAINMVNDKPEDIADLIREIKKLSNRPISIEMGNELEGPSCVFKDGKEYMERVRILSKAIKEIDPTIKIGVIAGEPHYVREKIISSEFWKAYKGGNLGCKKCAEWVPQISETPKDYDAVILHFYVYVKLEDFQHTPESLMAYGYANVACWEESVNHLSQTFFKGKEFWITEYNWLPLVSYCIEKPLKKRMDFIRKTPGEAIVNLDFVLRMINQGSVTQTDLHTFEGGSGAFSGRRNPAYYTHGMLGKTLKECDTYFPIESKNVKMMNFLLSWGNMSQGPERVYARYGAVGAWGFGSAEKIKYVYFANRTSKVQNVELNGKKLAKTWSYGGEKPFPYFLDYPENVMPDVPTPTVFDSEKPTAQLDLEPYSITVAEVK